MRRANTQRKHGLRSADPRVAPRPGQASCPGHPRDGNAGFPMTRFLHFLHPRAWTIALTYVAALCVCLVNTRGIPAYVSPIQASANHFGWPVPFAHCPLTAAQKREWVQFRFEHVLVVSPIELFGDTYHTVHVDTRMLWVNITVAAAALASLAVLLELRRTALRQAGTFSLRSVFLLAMAVAGIGFASRSGAVASVYVRNFNEWMIVGPVVVSFLLSWGFVAPWLIRWRVKSKLTRRARSTGLSAGPARTGKLGSLSQNRAIDATTWAALTGSLLCAFFGVLLAVLVLTHDLGVAVAVGLGCSVVAAAAFLPIWRGRIGALLLKRSAACRARAFQEGVRAAAIAGVVGLPFFVPLTWPLVYGDFFRGYCDGGVFFDILRPLQLASQGLVWQLPVGVVSMGAVGVTLVAVCSRWIGSSNPQRETA